MPAELRLHRADDVAFLGCESRRLEFLDQSIFLLKFSALADPLKEKYSVNKKIRVSLLENLNGWLGAGGDNSG